ncbi:MAG TPA: histidinol-phosphate transaminase [Gammaproteobacteria bacterium]|nr:histidinol-phosphate transaminase [Gammaproteobacteria bacterium]
MTVRSFVDLAVEGVRDLAPYQAGKPISELQRELGIQDIIKLASNENPLGPSPEALKVLRGQLEDLALYPDGNGFALKDALAKYHGVNPKQITLGSGSDHILELAARVFLGPGRSAVISRYGFAIYNIVAKAACAELRIAEANAPDHPTQPYGHNLDNMLAMIDDSTRMLFIANPNNPTGTWLSRAEMQRFLDAVPREVVVLVDEAYVDYVHEPDYPDCSQWLERYPNLVVTRTFSKAYGLAGLRVGYALANPEITDLLNRVRLAFNPNLLAQSAAVAALADRDHIARTVELNDEGLSEMAAAYAELGLKFIPSVCNFYTVDFGRPAMPIFDALLKEGVIVRPVANYGMPNHLRISIGTQAENRRLVAALRKVFG